MSAQDSETLIVNDEESSLRLDKLLALRFPEQSRTYFQSLIDKGLVLLNGQPVKKRIKPQSGDEIEVEFTLSPELSLSPEAMPLDILYEDEWLLIINKPTGLVVHPAPGHWSGTFVNGLLYHCQQLGSLESQRPGIVHRLDKETTGVLIAAKNETVQQRLVTLFSSRQVHKEYLAVCIGNPGTVTIEAPIGRHPTERKQMTVLREGGRHAVTQCHTLSTDGKLSVVHINLLTGRTHQIRVHMKYNGTPILGDPLYGNNSWNQKMKVQRQMLHAYRLSLTHPITHTPLSAVAPLPADMERVVKQLYPSFQG
jgi:23S rRNA pseudouridine1911/1915/1917 synthase